MIEEGSAPRATPQGTGRVRTRFQPPSPALVVSFVALFVALAGTALALQANSVGSKHIKKDAVRSKHVQDGALLGADLAAGEIRSAHIADDQVQNAHLASNAVTQAELASNAVGASELADNSVGSGEVTGNSLTGSDIDESALNLGAVPCHRRAVRGYARIKGLETMPSSYTSSSTYIAFGATNCGGSSIQVRRVGEGAYRVHFGESGALLGIASADGVLGLNIGGSEDLANDFDNNVSVTRWTDTGADFGSFHVSVRDDDGNPEDGAFAIAVF